MRTISSDDITKEVKRLCIEANLYLGEDVLTCIESNLPK